VLNTGQAWTPGGEVAEILVDIFRPIIADLIAEGGGAVGITVDSGGITVVPIPIKSNPSSGTTGSTESQ